MLLAQALKSWRGAKAVALLAAAALAVGIGSAAAIFAVVEAVLLRPIAYRDADRFVAIFSASFNDPTHYGTLSLRDAQELQSRTRAFDAFGWFRYAGQNLMFAGQPWHVEGVRVTTSLAHHVGVEPVLGRWFDAEQGVMLSSPLWRRLGADPDIVGKPIALDGRGYVIAGVMPDLFQLPVAGIPSPGFRADVWMPLDPTGRGEPGDGYFAYARRRPEVSFDAAVADLKRVAAELAAEDPVNRTSVTVRVFDLREIVVQRVRPTLLTLVAAAGLLFLITCANTAGLLLARSIARSRETAVRVALGARRRQLAAYYFAESLLVSITGAAGGVLLAVVLTPAIVAMAADYLPRAEEVSVNRAVLAFAVVAAVLASALASLAPLWQAMRTAPADALGEGVRTSASARSRRLSRSLVMAEIALAFALLTAGALLIGHLRTLSRVSPGFDADRLLTFVVSIPGTIARDGEARAAFQQNLVGNIRSVAGVDAVAFANQLPLDGCCWSVAIHPEGRTLDPSVPQRTSFMAVTPEYLATMRIPLRQGRLLADSDRIDGHMRALVNDAAVARYWGGQNPVGAFGRFGNSAGRRFEVVGVVGDIRNDGLDEPTVPEVYVLSSLPQVNVETMHFVVRTERSDPSLAADIRRAVERLDPTQPIHDVAFMREIIQRTMTLERVASSVTAFFAGAALLLATIGIYGVVAYSVRQRTVEIGTRMALGATRADVLALVVRGGLAMAAIGVGAGGAAALAGMPYLSSAFEIGPLGPAPFLYATAVVAGVAVASSSLPAWRATLVSPLVAIRNDAQSTWGAVRSTVAEAVRQLSTPAAAAPLDRLLDEFTRVVRGAAATGVAVRESVAVLGQALGAGAVQLLERDGDRFHDARLSVPARGFLVNRLRRYARPVAVTAADIAAWERWAQEFRPGHLDEIRQLAGSGIRLAVPLGARGDLVGILILGAPAGRDQYGAAEKQLLAGAAGILALMIENARLTARELEQEKLRRDLALAAEVQRRLLPPHAPRGAQTAFAAFTLPARTVGGDYYDFLELAPGRVGLAVADVSGKGIAAALVMSVVQASLRVIATDGALAPAAIAGRMNAFLHQATGANKYATFFYADIDAARRRLRYVNAGHNPPLLARRRPGGVEIVELTAGGTVLGLFPEMGYDETAIDLCPGDLLVAFTDGVTEALNDRGEEFGDDRLRALLRAAAATGADDFSATISAAMQRWIGGAEQHDDLTVVVMSVG